jgi:hypothetical protein
MSEAQKGLKKMLKFVGQGSVLRGWRKMFDISCSGEVEFMRFCKGLSSFAGLKAEVS